MHILCFLHPVSSALAYASGLLASAGLLTGILLLHRHEGLEVAEAHEAVRYLLLITKIGFSLPPLQQAYLNEVRSQKFKFQGVALAYSLPRVLLLAGFVAFFCQWVVIIWRNNNPIYAVPLICLILSAFLGLQNITARTSILGTLKSQTTTLYNYIFDRSSEIKDSAV